MTISDALGADEISNVLPAFVRKSHKLSEVGGAFLQSAPNCGCFGSGDTANPTERISGSASYASSTVLSSLRYCPSEVIK